jgi:Protein of unknown function (DUF3828)
LAQDSPQALVNQFYQWYLKTESIRPQFAQQKALFSPELYTQLTKAWTKKPGQDNFVDFDVFSGTQVGMAKAVVRSIIWSMPEQAIGATCSASCAILIDDRGFHTAILDCINHNEDREGAGVRTILDSDFWLLPPGSWLLPCLASLISSGVFRLAFLSE